MWHDVQVVVHSSPAQLRVYRYADGAEISLAFTFACKTKDLLAMLVVARMSSASETPISKDHQVLGFVVVSFCGTGGASGCDTPVGMLCPILQAVDVE